MKYVDKVLLYVWTTYFRDNRTAEQFRKDSHESIKRDNRSNLIKFHIHQATNKAAI